MIRFVVTAGFVILFLIFSIPLLIIEWIIGKYNQDLKNRSCQTIVRWAFRLCSVLAGTDVTYIGTENIPQDGSFLYVSNHRSYFDIVLTYPCFPHPTGYVAKSEMIKIPLLAIWMRNIHCLFLNRESVREGMKAILKGIEELKDGISICIFPEGTRATDPDELLPFHEGSFRMAEKAKCPIIPISITNTSTIWEDHMPVIKKSRVIIEFGAPIVPETLTREDRKFLGAYVRRQIQEMYTKNKAMLS